MSVGLETCPAARRSACEAARIVPLIGDAFGAKKPSTAATGHSRASAPAGSRRPPVRRLLRLLQPRHPARRSRRMGLESPADAACCISFLVVVAGRQLFIGFASSVAAGSTQSSAGCSSLSACDARRHALALSLCFSLPIAGFGPERWLLSLQNPASSGYFSVASDLRNVRPPGRPPRVPSRLRMVDRRTGQLPHRHASARLVPRLSLALRTIEAASANRRSRSGAARRIALTKRRADFGRQQRASTADIAMIVAAAFLTWLAFWLSTPFVYLLARHGASPAGVLRRRVALAARAGPPAFPAARRRRLRLLLVGDRWLLIAAPPVDVPWRRSWAAAAGIVFFVALN